MDRRNFVKLVGTASGGAMTGACGNEAREIIPLLVPEKAIAPGVEEWHPGVCQECGAGCGVLARVMESERVVEVDGERVRQRIAAIKKLEGNPLDPVSGGRLCGRGHASLQSLYNPDRLTAPLKRVGSRGAGEFRPIGWEEALAEAGELLTGAVAADPDKILFLARPRASSRSANIARFLQALGAPPARGIGVGDFAAEREAARRVFGWDGIPVYEIQDATYVLSIGADFLGGWVSPVLYARRYGHMRQGRPELRGRLAHAESRFSLTAWNADRWLPVWPGGETALALAIGQVLVSEQLARGLKQAPAELVEAFAAVDFGEAARASGLPGKQIRETAAELAAASAPVVLAGASMVRPDSAEAVAAASALNVLLGNVGQPGGVLPGPADPGTGLEAFRPSSGGWIERLAEAALVLVDGVNPAYNAPFSERLLAEAGALISFSPFLDDTAAYADLILPDLDPLESASLVLPDSAPVPAVTGAAAFVQPLHGSRSTDAVLTELAEAAGRPFEQFTAEEGLGALHANLNSHGTGSSPADFAAESLRRGGWRGDRAAIAPARPEPGPFAVAPKAEGLLFQAYPSLQFGDGSGANRPWLQELPDPASSAIWGVPVELDPGTAANLGVANGQLVRVTSERGSLEAPVYVNPAAIPGVVSMAVGQGHRHYGGFASGRGANPLALLPEAVDPATGALAWGPVPVALEKTTGPQRLIQFSRQDRDLPPHRV